MSALLLGGRVRVDKVEHLVLLLIRVGRAPPPSRFCVLSAVARGSCYTLSTGSSHFIYGPKNVPGTSGIDESEGSAVVMGVESTTCRSFSDISRQRTMVVDAVRHLATVAYRPDDRQNSSVHTFGIWTESSQTCRRLSRRGEEAGSAQERVDERVALEQDRNYTRKTQRKVKTRIIVISAGLEKDVS